MNNKTLIKSRLILQLKSNSSYNKRNYKIMSVLKLIWMLNMEDIAFFIKNPKEYDFLQSNKEFDGMI